MNCVQNEDCISNLQLVSLQIAAICVNAAFVNILCHALGWKCIKCRHLFQNLRAHIVVFSPYVSEVNEEFILGKC